jgi:hypothetical protein
VISNGLNLVPIGKNSFGQLATAKNGPEKNRGTMNALGAVLAKFSGGLFLLNNIQSITRPGYIA